MLLPDLSRRRLQPELMDDPALDAHRHRKALESLRRVNVLSATAGRVWEEVLSLGPVRTRPFRVLDVACGGGDVVLELKRRAESAGLPLEVHGCDRSALALDHARKAAEKASLDVRFLELDAVEGDLPRGYDLVCSSLFLHHLTEDVAVGFLRATREVAPALFVQDLRRTRTGYLLALLTLNTLARSDVARVDGLRSVAGAFTLAETRRLAERAGLSGFSLQRCWPQRFVLTWRRR